MLDLIRRLNEVHKYLVIDGLNRATRDKFWSGGRGLARAPQVREHALTSTFCAPHRHGQEASRPVQDPDLDSLRLCNPLQEHHWLGLVRQFRMTSRSATRWIRAWHSFPERELVPFRPLLLYSTDAWTGNLPFKGFLNGTPVQAPVQVSTVLTMVNPPVSAAAAAAGYRYRIGNGIRGDRASGRCRSPH